jgi:hypothetical protein
MKLIENLEYKRVIRERLNAWSDMRDGYPTRSDFLVANAQNPGLNLVDGQLVWANGLSYRRQIGATTANLQGFIPDGYVTPEHFGALADGMADDTAAIQSAFDTGKHVVLSGSAYRTTAPLTLRTQKIFGRSAIAGRAQVLMLPQGNFPCFVNPSDDFNSFEIDGFFINYGENAPVSASGNDQKIGFKFTGATMWPEGFKISNCTVRGAWHALYDLSGSYMSLLDRVEARHCKIGFYKQGGTTIVWSNVFARGDGVNSEMGFWIREAISGTFISCAADLLRPGGNVYAQTANMFEGCPGVTILGWDAESNDIPANYSYMRFTDAGGSVSLMGFLGYQNVLRANTGEESTLLLLDGVNAQISGKMRFSPGDLAYVGDGGVPITIKAINSAKVLISGADVPETTGGTPGAAFSILGVGGAAVTYTATSTSGLVSGAHELLSGSAVTQSDSDVTPGRLLTTEAGPAQAFRRGNVLGAVSQASGVPTGAIIERGSNANGEFVRYADGTLICTRTNLSAANANAAVGSLFRSANVTWTFPAAFAAAPSVSGDVDDPDSWMATAAAPGTTSASLRVMAAVTKAAALNFRAIAIGRWF